MALPDDVAATSNTIFAPGAMAWAYSTSKLVSMVHPNTSCLGFVLMLALLHWLESNGLGAFPQKMVKDGGLGIPKTASKTARSFVMVGLPKASTITMVCPDPS